MARERLPLGLVAVVGGVEDPDLEQVVAAPRDEAAVARSAGAGGARHNGAWGGGWRPRHRVDAQAVGGEGGVLEAVVLEFEDRNVAVGGGAG